MQNIVFVEKFLSDELALSKKEILLYTNLIKYGGLTILELSEISGINRATTHVNVENLTQKSLVTQVKKGRGSRRLIMAEPPEKLFVIFQDRKAKLEAAEDQLGLITQELASLKKEHRQSGGMEIRHYEGRNEVKLIYEDVLKAKEIRSYLNYKELIKVFPANPVKFIEAQKKQPDMQMWEILEDSKEAREYIKQTHIKNYHCRLATQKLNLASFDYIMFDGKIAAIDLSEGNNAIGIVIENKNFYNNAKALHKFVWQLLPTYKE